MAGRPRRRSRLNAGPQQPRLFFGPSGGWHDHPANRYDPGALPGFMALKAGTAEAQSPYTTAHVYLSPDNYLEMTTTRPSRLHEPQVRRIMAAMEQGGWPDDGPYAPPGGLWLFGVPQLIVERGGPEGQDWEITEHEGRHRAQAMKLLGYHTVPVVLIFRPKFDSTSRIEDDERVQKLLQGHDLLVRTQSYPAAHIQGRLKWLRPLTLKGETPNR